MRASRILGAPDIENQYSARDADGDLYLIIDDKSDGGIAIAGVATRKSRSGMKAAAVFALNSAVPLRSAGLLARNEAVPRNGPPLSLSLARRAKNRAGPRGRRKRETRRVKAARVAAPRAESHFRGWARRAPPLLLLSKCATSL